MQDEMPNASETIYYQNHFVKTKFMNELSLLMMLNATVIDQTSVCSPNRDDSHEKHMKFCNTRNVQFVQSIP